ncbi:hypothetical protein RHGRI_018528 [Rhododendron griersonianum]|uniref:FAR1 domain-containing protein n=1 Tax=Rhododendron griersonianum TaxID=479676 RepID=A0AAV6K1S8_9ERIC|nr:hypothetical protein RHGRI_018528 [Rhododendron griersonianum]
MEDLEMVDVLAEMGVPGVDDIQPKPVIGMEFDSESSAYDFYNFYGGSMGFSIRKNNAAKSKSGEITSRTFVCSKEGHRKHDKRDYQTKNPRAETRTDCDALMAIKLIRQIGKYRVTEFVDIHNHPLVPSDLAHMLPSRRKISASQCVQIDLAHDSRIPLRSSYELIGKEAGGRECLGYLKVDQKNYLRTRRQNMLAFGEAGSILKLCTWHMMQNALKHMNSIFRGPSGVREVLGKFLDEYEEEEFVMAWNAMLDEYNLRGNTWLQRIFDLREKWARPYVRWAWSAGMNSTQLSESFNSDLKDYLRSDHNLVQFFTHFERLLDEKRCKEREADHAIKVLKDAMNIMEIPSQYILRRWTRVARAEVVQDFRGRDIEADPKLEKNTRYKSLCSLFNKIASRASELKDT